MKLSSCIWALTGSDVDVIRRHTDLGFDTIDIRPDMLRTPDARAAREDAIVMSLQLDGAAT